MGSTSCKANEPEIATHVLHERQTPNHGRSNYMNINTDTCAPPIPYELSSLQPETLDMRLALHNVTQLDVDPPLSGKDDVLDAAAIAIDVMTSTLPSISIEDNHGNVTSIATTVNSEIIENLSLHSRSNSSLPPLPPDYTTMDHPLRTHHHRQRSSNLIHPRASGSWQMEDIDQMAYEMRCQMRLLRSQNSFSKQNSMDFPPLDDSEDDSDDDSEDDEEDTVVYDVDGMVSDNIRLTKAFHLKQNENMEQSNIIKQQQKQIEELQRMIQQMQQTD